MSGDFISGFYCMTHFGAWTMKLQNVRRECNHWKTILSVCHSPPQGAPEVECCFQQTIAKMYLLISKHSCHVSGMAGWNIGAICCDPRSGSDKYSPTNERKNRVKNTRWRSHRVFFTRFFLEFGVNIWNSAERSSAYCHYSSFFGRHNQQWWIPANIQHFSQYCGAEKRGIMVNI